MLKRCSDKKDMTEWNEWREENPDNDIELDGAEFSSCYLKGVNLATYREYMRKTPEVNLSKAKFNKCDLENANFQLARMENAELHQAFMKGVRLDFSHLEGALLLGTDIRSAALIGAHLEKANLCNSNLSGSRLTDAHVEGTDIRNAQLEGSDFRMAFVDCTTSLFHSRIDRHTDFRGAGLGSCRIDPATKQLLEYNIRRMNWEEWYPKQHRLLAWLVRKFWWISDYGISTKRIIFTFFGLAFVFAIVYYAWGLIDYLVGNKDYPGIVSNLFVLEDNKRAVSGWLVPLRAIYFSIVTMTTLGFGDMYANAHSLFRGIAGHILLALQVILGYVLLGALVTRFAVLFTAGGPAGKFADDQHAKTVA